MDALPPEYCLFTIQHWFFCLTKAEWAGWAQLLGVVASIWIAARIADRTFRREREAIKADQETKRMQVISAIAQSLEACVAISERLIEATTPITNRTDADIYRLLQYMTGDGPNPGLAADIFAMDMHANALDAVQRVQLGDSTLLQKLVDAKFSISVLRSHMELLANAKVEVDWTAGFMFGKMVPAYNSLLESRNQYWEVVTGNKGLVHG